MDNCPSDLALIAGQVEPAFALARDYSHGTTVAPHRHEVGQLLHALSGVILAETPGQAWAVPPGRALWLPPGMVHRFAMRGDVQVRTLYVRPGIWAGAPEAACVMRVSALVRELILRALGGDSPSDEARVQALVIPLLLAELGTAARENLGLALPASAALRKFAAAVRRDPAGRLPLETLARSVGLTGKTLARRFGAETGMTPDGWRRLARLLEAVARLRSGSSVTEVAFDLGYKSVSAFSQAFRANFGTTSRRMRE